MLKEFYKYLISTGYNETEATEYIKKIERGDYDQEIENELQRQRNKIRKEKKNE